MLRVTNLRKRFGSIKAVNGISFKVERGTILGFLGPNGAGKTTTMRMITGFLPPTNGSISVCDHDVGEEPVAAKKCIGYLPENAPLYPGMTVTSFLEFIAGIRGFHGKEQRMRVARTIEQCYLGKVRNQSIGTLSKGYNQRVCLAQAVLHDPDMLILDEPTDGLDPNQKHTVRTMIRDMAKEKAIVISTHILEEVDAVCTRVIIINDGRMVANGTPDELKAMTPSGRLDDVFRQLTIGNEEPAEAKQKK